MTAESDCLSKRESEIRSEISKLVEVNPVTLDMSFGRIAEVRREREKIVEERYATLEEKQHAKALLKGFEHEEEMERREDELRSVPHEKLWLQVQHDDVLSGYLPIPPMKGKGGTSEIWICKSRFAERTSVIKLLTIQGGAANLRPALALRELQTVFNLRHPNIVNVFDAGYLKTEEGEFPYVAMEEVPGITLHEWTSEKNSSHSSKTAAIAVSAIANAVQFCHDSGIAHGDLKPDNILVSGSEPTKDTIKLIDFGFAGSHGGAPLGASCGYSDPSPRSEQHLSMTYRDIFALGGILYFVHTGQHPKPAAGLSKSEWQVWLKEIDLGNSDLTLICRRCLAYDRAERYATAKQLEEDLAAWLGNHPLPHVRKGNYSRWEKEAKLWERSRTRDDVADHTQIIARALLILAILAGANGVGYVWLLVAGFPPEVADDLSNIPTLAASSLLFVGIMFAIRFKANSVKIIEPLMASAVSFVCLLYFVVPTQYLSAPNWQERNVAGLIALIIVGIVNISFASLSSEWKIIRPIGWAILASTFFLRPLFESQSSSFAMPVVIALVEVIVCLFCASRFWSGPSKAIQAE